MNGYTNYETWNVSLWIFNEEPYYRLAQQSKDYAQFVSRMSYIYGQTATPDGVSYSDPNLDTITLDEEIIEA